VRVEGTSAVTDPLYIFLPAFGASLTVALMLITLSVEQKFRGAAPWWAWAHLFFCFAMAIEVPRVEQHVDLIGFLAGMAFNQFAVFILLGALPGRRRATAVWLIPASAALEALILYSAAHIPVLSFLSFGFNFVLLLTASSSVVQQPAARHERWFHRAIAVLLALRAGLSLFLGLQWVLSDISLAAYAVSTILIVGNGSLLVMLEHFRARCDLERMRDDLITAQRGAERASREKTALLAGLSHELRTPLNAVLGYAEAVRYLPQEVVAERAGGYFRDIERAALSLKRLIDQLLGVAQIEQGERRLALAPVDLAAVAQRCLSHSRAHHLPIPLTRNWVCADPVILDQVVATLITAIDAALPADGSGGLRIHELPDRPDRLRLGITVTGAPEGLQLGRQLDGQYQGQTSSEATQSGLSLSIARHLMRLMDGDLEPLPDGSVALSLTRTSPPVLSNAAE